MCDNERKYALCNGLEGLTYRNQELVEVRNDCKRS